MPLTYGDPVMKPVVDAIDKVAKIDDRLVMLLDGDRLLAGIQAGAYA